jgi:hypothetical protein
MLNAKNTPAATSPSEQAALKVLYLAVREQITPKARDLVPYTPGPTAQAS